jgi:CubicO group peptidase (beta-lactamase class C family)
MSPTRRYSNQTMVGQTPGGNVFGHGGFGGSYMMADPESGTARDKSDDHF